MGEEQPLPLPLPPQPVEGHLTPKPPPGAGSLEKVKSMDVDPIPSPLSAPKPSWFTPVRLLVIFCVINLINYLDRGAIASNGVNGSRKTCTKNGKCSPGTGIQGDFDLNNFKDGVVSSAFMVGLLVASPIFASLTKRVNPFRLIGIGLSVWTIATAGCGFSKNFWSIAIFRMLVGVGEASFISLAAPFIDDNAPPAKRTFWLGAFYMCIPTGIAVGYVYGGLCGGYNWRLAFWVEAVLMLPFAILGFAMKPLQLKGFSPVGSKTALTSAEEGTEKQGELSSREEVADQISKNIGSTDDECIVIRFFKDMKILLLDQVYVVNVLGYIAYNFVVGAYSYWGPKAGYNIYHMKNADYTFGGITVVCGILGSLAGGFALDYMTSTISNAFKLLPITTLFGAIFCLAAFCSKSLIAYVIIFSIGELLIFATQAPVNFVCLHCVTPSLRPLSMAMSTVCIHIFGDVPSSPLVGLLQDHLNNWRKTALILTSILFVAAAIWFIGIFLRSVDRFDEESENPVTTIDKSNTTTSLEVKKTETA
ncbi:unnamed protein product [Fraxinus pennsylvanica]|uniref:Major facilitator superfamily (MFS) profile domain-containing protein n=1 Tax=Fraxinus pennsylvanica TaxID=56036 RepID=A0AAD2DY69_9LAMI|nr:unnamed protein product [Fraxinus pennsylvanica]